MVEHIISAIVALSAPLIVIGVLGGGMTALVFIFASVHR